MKLDSPLKLSPMTIFLHWLVGIVMVGMLVVGVYMVETETFHLYAWHKAIGFLIFFVIVYRIVWRIKNGWPIPVTQYKKTEQILAKAVDWILIIGTVILPISGFLQSSLSGHGVNVFGFEVVARNIDPNNIKKIIAHNKELESFFHFIHYQVSYIVIGALVLHVSGTFKHHFIDKDNTLRRMLGLKF